MSEEVKKGRDSSVVAKAGLWYTVCNFMFRGMAFITTPIFTRLMSKTEVGEFSNFSSWASILLIITSFDLAQSVIRSKLEHEDDMDSYIWSILCFSTIWTMIVYLVVCLFPDFFADLFQIEPKYIHLMFMYLITAPAYSMLVTKHRAFYKYKTFVLLTGIMTVSGTLLSLLMVILMQDRLAGRLYGYYVPHIVIGACIFIFLVARGKKIKVKYWKYACVICLPLVPHELSLYVLSASDKVIVKRLSGAEYTAIYSIAYSAYHIATILFDSMNKAFAPWLLESLHHKNYKDIKKTSKIYISVFVMLVISVLILAPEIIWVLGGKQYAGAVNCIPPLIASCVIQLVYRMYVNIEFYEKKTVGVAIATMIAAAINIILNFILIPMDLEHSYVIASYTTLIGYLFLLIFHYITVRMMKMHHVYDTGFIIRVLIGVFIISASMNALYGVNAIVRYIIVLIYGVVILYFGYRHKQRIAGIFRKKK